MTADIHDSFNPSTENTQIFSNIGWFAKNYPDLTQNYVIVSPDNQFGHIVSGLYNAALTAFGVKPTNIFFPAQQTDLSATGSKVSSMNPGVLTSGAGDNNVDGNVYKTVRNAGWKGQIFSPSPATTQALLQMVPGELLEGFISGALPPNLIRH